MLNLILLLANSVVAPLLPTLASVSVRWGPGVEGGGEDASCTAAAPQLMVVAAARGGLGLPTADCIPVKVDDIAVVVDAVVFTAIIMQFRSHCSLIMICNDLCWHHG